jgi:hypothetical protein
VNRRAAILADRGAHLTGAGREDSTANETLGVLPIGFAVNDFLASAGGTLFTEILVAPGTFDSHRSPPNKPGFFASRSFRSFFFN